MAALGSLADKLGGSRQVIYAGPQSYPQTKSEYRTHMQNDRRRKQVLIYERAGIIVDMSLNHVV